MKTLYLAKEPDAGVRNDFANINGEITIVDCLNGYLDWYRKKSYNCISKTKYFELDGTMLFDAVVGNPPYQDSDNAAKNNKLWHKFVLKALTLCKPGGHIKLVTPSSIIGETGFGKKMLKAFSSQYNMVSIDYTTKRHFSTVGVDICCWHVINEPYQGKTKVINKDGVSYHNLEEGMPFTGDALIVHSILDKVANSAHPRIKFKMGQDIAKKDYVEDGEYEVYSSADTIKRTNIVPTTNPCLKFIVPYSSSYKKRFTAKGYVGLLNMYCHVKSVEEGDYLSSIFDVPLVKFFVERYHKTAGFTPAVKKSKVPYLDDLTDINQQFNLSPEEVQYLENNNYA